MTSNLLVQVFDSKKRAYWFPVHALEKIVDKSNGYVASDEYVAHIKGEPSSFIMTETELFKLWYEPCISNALRDIATRLEDINSAVCEIDTSGLGELATVAHHLRSIDDTMKMKI